MQQNQRTLRTKIFVGFSIPVSLLIINALIFVVAVDRQQAVLAQIAEKSAHDVEYDVKAAIDEITQANQRIKAMSLATALLGIVMTIMIAVLIARTLQVQTAVKNGDVLKGELVAMRQQLEALIIKL